MLVPDGSSVLTVPNSKRRASVNTFKDVLLY